MRIAVLADLSVDLYNVKEYSPDEPFWNDLDEFENSQSIVSALIQLGHEAKYIPANFNSIPYLLDYQPDLCFNYCDGYSGFSREAQVPALLDMLHLPYTGTGVLGMSLSYDKYMAKKLFQWLGLPTADCILVPNPNQIPTIGLDFPVFIKPVYEDSSFGINENSVAYDVASLNKQVHWVWDRTKASVLIEKFIEGREITISVLGEEVLPIVEIILPTGYYSYNQKKDDQKSGIYRICPAQISEAKKQELRRITSSVMKELNLFDFCRIDFRMDPSGNVFILEANPIPFLEPNPATCSYVKSAFTAGYTYNEMIHKIIDAAVKRLNLF